MAKMVLIVEDDSFLSGLEAKKLKKEGYDVCTAANSTEAFSLIGGPNKIDLILLDLMLPEVDGFTILEKIRSGENNKNMANVPVIIFSNLSEEKDIDRAKSLGVNEFMVKSNFTLDELVQKVRELVGE
jgi:DNA-binding response OmpR family regulator